MTSADCKSVALWHMGFESLILHQVFGLEVFMDAHNTVTVEEGDRYPSRPPCLCPGNPRQVRNLGSTMSSQLMAVER